MLELVAAKARDLELGLEAHVQPKPPINEVVALESPARGGRSPFAACDFTLEEPVAAINPGLLKRCVFTATVDKVGDFLQILASVKTEDIVDLPSSETPYRSFAELCAYLGSSPRLMDAVITAGLLSGSPEPAIAALGAHLLISVGGTAPRSLRSTSSKGVNKALKV
ncbi:hypothetical protein AK812_SmicGene16107 [Symbiodinium microadriaticum]|uniref:Uncharacterized protein n=1 Tax=Symbiodinium microadriaticum TaxID=2951 RepID=A0A1Q9E177_SYMMI|nr:hypothetical protein AK812_SmicGene16107 [Symbiodinium microadriaticum]